MIRSNDLRVEKTYDALITALLKLLQEKPLEKLTVNELCEEAKIRRPTFYKHFNDKYTFFTFAIQTLQSKYLLKAEQQTDTTHPVDFFINFFTTILNALEEYQKIFLTLQVDLVSVFSLESTDKLLDKQFQEYLQHFIIKEELHLTDPEFDVQILLGMFRQVGGWWLKNQDRVSKEETIKKMTKILERFFSLNTR
ncbi:TetR/AcrR family transcriptional regulator [Carnobacterium sp.]|uniref:TetR/AcrR family transcriptional regulator n=1 Tax=Carnobacterium sp. TaxID=48221 RepID=UPI0028B07668|nr:TetR/AcrR family transcriptional regulator [Carnobacterium sp.]